jgi:uncharacterized protein involved in tolerance to divalent cations
LHWQQHGGQNIDLWRLKLPPCVVSLHPSFFPAITWLEMERLETFYLSWINYFTNISDWFAVILIQIDSYASTVALVILQCRRHFQVTTLTNWREQVVPWKEYMLLNR